MAAENIRKEARSIMVIAIAARVQDYESHFRETFTFVASKPNLLSRFGVKEGHEGITAWQESLAASHAALYAFSSLVPQKTIGEHG